MRDDDDDEDEDGGGDDEDDAGDISSSPDESFQDCIQEQTATPDTRHANTTTGGGSDGGDEEAGDAMDPQTSGTSDSAKAGVDISSSWTVITNDMLASSCGDSESVHQDSGGGDTKERRDGGDNEGESEGDGEGNGDGKGDGGGGGGEGGACSDRSGAAGDGGVSGSDALAAIMSRLTPIAELSLHGVDITKENAAHLGKNVSSPYQYLIMDACITRTIE